MSLPWIEVDRIIDVALHEDLAGGDLTSESCVDAAAQAQAIAITRHPMVVCGGAVFARVFERVDPAISVEVLAADGTMVAAAETIWRVRGAARSVLGAERVALNLTQRMCGIASMARSYADAVAEGANTRITDTRKTMPGLRVLDRYAVRTGGAHNHRDNLGSAVMIKDNHIAAAGGITLAVQRAQAHAPHSCRIEVEVSNLDEFEEARAARADIIMLDNMSTAQVAEAVGRLAADREAGTAPLIEVSGGVTIERVTELSEAGADVISVGALTHSVKAADISLEFSLEAAGG